MDQELKQRLIGAAVVTALAAIFIPMLFDDPVDTSGQAVSGMTIPEPPPSPDSNTSSKLPADAASVDSASPAGIIAGPDQAPADAADNERIEPELLESTIDYEPPVEVDPSLEQQLDQAAEGEPVAEPDLQNGTQDTDDDNNDAADDQAAESAAPTAPIKTMPVPAETEKTPLKPAPSQAKVPVKTGAGASEANPAEKTSAPLAKAETSFERWSVQTGFFSKKENAVSQSQKLRKLGYPVMMYPEKTAKGTRYRVKVGPELSRQRAVDLKGRLAQQNFDAILVAE